MTGRFDLPLLNGTAKLGEIHFIPRGFIREIRIDPGAEINFAVTDAAKGEQMISIPRDEGKMTGMLEDGSCVLTGESKWKKWRLERVFASILGTDLYYSKPGEYEVTFVPNLDFTADSLDDSDKRKMKLTGDITILDGQYTKSFTKFTSSFLRALTKQRVGQFQKPITEVFGG